MKNSRWVGGIILMLLAAVIFFFNVTDYYTPAAITLLIVGAALVATARRNEAGQYHQEQTHPAQDKQSMPPLQGVFGYLPINGSAQLENRARA